MPVRKIVQIDEAKCDGCGQCVPSCAEGAIRIVNGKARLVSDVYCDGLGACLGHCPQGAIEIIEREAPNFDEHAVHEHLQAKRHSLPLRAAAPHGGGCPGSAARMFAASSPAAVCEGDDTPSALGQWPVQLHLVPPVAPFLQDADLLLVADCVPFAYADFHAKLLRGRPVVIGCPKLDDGRAYVDKLAAIMRQGSLRSLTVVRMEVPCCMGLMHIAAAARQQSGVDLPIEEIVISIRGQRKE